MIPSLLQDKNFADTEGLLGGTLKTLNTMLKSGGGYHMYYLIAFVVFVFFAIYWISGSTKTTI